MDDEHGEITDEEMAQALAAEERLQCPPRQFAWRRVACEWLDNTGRLFEHLAEFPYALSRNVMGAQLQAEDERGFTAEASAEIERLTGGQDG